MSKLGPVSQAMLDYIQERQGYINIFKMMSMVHAKTGAKHSNKWYFRRLAALALEGRIDANVYRRGDHLNIRFRRLPPDLLEDLPGIEENEQ